MTSVFDKLQLKHQREILVVNAPASFEPQVETLKNVKVLRNPNAASAFGFALAFATKQSDVDALSKSLAPKADGDALLWFAYPKSTSKKYSCDFHRDTGWAVLKHLGFDTVRAVAIDEDWSALRFRRVEFIKPKKGPSSR